uniref:Uncharacterized protein n=1 Tax=Glossina austeni TaxID=7395 RepID=A0A1A9V4J7_GLOAU
MHLMFAHIKENFHNGRPTTMPTIIKINEKSLFFTSAKIVSHDALRDFSSVEARPSNIDCKQLLNLINNSSNHHFVISSIAFMAVTHLHLSNLCSSISSSSS